MGTVFGSLYHFFASANPVHWCWCGAMLLIMLVLGVLHHRWREEPLKLLHWRILCLLPLLLTGIHGLIYTAGAPMLTRGFVRLYAVSVLALFPMLVASRKTAYRIIAPVTGVLSVLVGLYFCAMSPNFHNFTRKGYSASFHAMVQTMDREYVLKEWKEVDFSALEEKYMPAVREAEQEQNPAKFADAVTLFCCELHDGHVSAEENYDFGRYDSVFEQHEYGLSMVRLDSGEVIAVCTTEAVNRLGITDGTVITHWNGKPVLQAAQEDTLIDDLPVKENSDRIRVMELSGIGGETVAVTFLGADGTAQTVTLFDLGGMHTLHEAFTCFDHSPDSDVKGAGKAFRDANFSAEMLDDKCGCLILNAETLPGDLLGFQTISGFLTGDQKYAREQFRARLRGLKAQGMEYLVIDLRNNAGGSFDIASALCELLTDSDWYSYGLGIRKNGQYTCVSDRSIRGTGEFAGLPVVALTNYNCASAGDGAALCLSKLPNVTLAGMTDPYGCGQETGGVCALSDGVVYVTYPTGLTLDENGDPNIDTRTDRISRDPVEVRIPLDYDAAMKLFRDKQDYELYWAVAYLESQNP